MIHNLSGRLLFDALKRSPPGLLYLFFPVIILLAASAFSGLVGIFPRTYRNRRYENLLTYHEVIVGKKPYDTYRERLVFRFKRLWTRKNNDKGAFDNFRNRIMKEDISDESKLEKEVLSAYMLSKTQSYGYMGKAFILTSYRRHNGSAKSHYEEIMYKDNMRYSTKLIAAIQTKIIKKIAQICYNIKSAYPRTECNL